MFLTRRQREIYEHIKEFIGTNGYAPSIVEIGKHFHLTSPATVHKHLQNIAEKGLIKRSWNRSRAIELVPGSDTIGASAETGAGGTSPARHDRGGNADRGDRGYGDHTAPLVVGRRQSLRSSR